MAINPDKCIKVTGRFHSTQGTVGEPALTNVVAGADEVYDDTVPYRYNGHIDCKEVTPVGTENPQELEWYEKVYNTLEPTLFEWVKTTDTSVDSEKTYGISIGAKQSDVNKQLYNRLDDIYEVTINADDVSKVITSDANKIINKEDGYVPTAAAVGEALGANFEDSLTSTSTVKGLTANMGRELNEIKANKNGWYEQLVSGASLSLIGDDVDHKATFLERETGDSTATGGTNYSVDKGTATIEAIYGHTEKFNQMIDMSSFPTTTIQGIVREYSNNIYHIYGTCVSNTFPPLQVLNIIQGHKYLYIPKFSGTEPNTTTYVIFENSNMFGQGLRSLQPSIITASNGGQSVVSLGLYRSDTSIDAYISIQLINLTAIFGAGNEPSTVEEFEAWLANTIGIQDYYDYTPGTLISLNPDSLVSTGFNQWDEEWEVGYINTGTGQNEINNSRIRSKNYINVFSSTEYYMFIGASKTFVILAYDINKNFIGVIKYPNSSNGWNFTTNADCYYIRFASQVDAYGTTYNHDICISLSDPVNNGKYMPYREPSMVDLSWIKDIPDPNDSGKKLFPYGLLKAGNVCDEVTATKAIKRIGSVDLGTLTWTAIGGNETRHRASIVNGTKNDDRPICTKYDFVSYNNREFVNGKCWMNGGENSVAIMDDNYTDQSSFKAAMNGVILYYELATPIEVTFEESNIHPMNYEAEDGGREKILPENTSTPTTTSLVADIRYPLNALEAIRKLQNNFSTQGALYQTFNSLCSALNSAITTGTFAVAPDETVIGKFNFTFTPTENTQSVEPNETI